MSLLVDSTPLKKNTIIVGTCAIMESKKLYFNNTNMVLWRTVEDNTIILLQYTDVGTPKFYDSFLIGVLNMLDVFST